MKTCKGGRKEATCRPSCAALGHEACTASNTPPPPPLSPLGQLTGTVTHYKPVQTRRTADTQTRKGSPVTVTAQLLQPGTGAFEVAVKIAIPMLVDRADPD